MENFTRGPWTIVKCDCGSDFCDKWQIKEVGTFYQGGVFKKPDAQLFATAPDMYSRLKAAGKHLRDVITFLKMNSEEVGDLTAVWDGTECDGYCLLAEAEAMLWEIEYVLEKARGEV